MNGTSNRKTIVASILQREKTTIAEVFDELSVSRSWLEPRFRRVLGRTIHREIGRVRIERAKKLLAETALPIKQIVQHPG